MVWTHFGSIPTCRHMFPVFTSDIHSFIRFIAGSLQNVLHVCKWENSRMKREGVQRGSGRVKRERT